MQEESGNVSAELFLPLCVAWSLVREIAFIIGTG
jgi:hypothetical protein